MKNSLCLGVLAVTCLGLGTANAQPPTMLPPANVGPIAGAPTVMPSVPFPAAPTQSAPAAPSGINEYLAYPRPAGCCTPGCDGLIGSEAYVRSGVSVNLGNTGVFGRVLDPGFMVTGGLRSIFFQPSPNVGWTVDVGLSSVWYDAGRDERANIRNFVSNTTVFGQNVQTIIPSFAVTPSSVNQTSVHLALGQEYYFAGDADPADGGWKWRAGWDAGGRWGTSKLVLKEIKHKTDVIGGALFGLHSDVEIPYGHCLFQVGVRAEYNYMWSDIIQSQNNTDIMSLNLMLTGGVRF